MFINNRDLLDLISINNELNSPKLTKIISKLLNQKEKTNKKNWQRIKNKRKTNKCYARSQKEIEKYYTKVVN